MIGTGTLDDLEGAIARALAAKADQLVVEEPRTSPLDDGGPPATVFHLTPPRPSRRRVVATAAAVVLVVAGLGVASRFGGGAPRVGPPAGAGTAVHGGRTSGPVGFVPDAVPPGWSLATLDVGAFMDDGPRHWQLFGAGDATPVDRGVLVASEARDARTIEGATRRVHGQPAWVGPPADPAHPAGAINASWAEDGVVHDVISVGLDEDELVAFLDGLVRRDEPISGFDVSDPTLRELASATVAGVRTTSATFVGPGGPADTVRVTAESTDRYGGLLHRLDGADSPGGPVRRGRLDGDDRYGFVRQARDDGWSVEVLSDGSVTAADDPSVLDAFLSALRPATAQQLEELALAQPVTATLDAGLGRTVELHGTAGEDMGLCLARQGGGDTVCGVAEALPEPGTLVASSLVVDGRWVVVTVTDDRPPHVRTDPENLQWASESQLSDRVGPADGQILVSVLHAPQEAATVAITVPTSDDTASGFTYQNPLR